MRVEQGKVTREPWASRATCANGHDWTPETTRWRIRRDKGESSPTRDCLLCRWEFRRRQGRSGATKVASADRSDEVQL